MKNNIEKLPKVSLLIVVRNEKDYIEKSLNSLLNQNYPKELTEIIIVDGMSTDGTKEWLNKKIEQLRNEGVDIKLSDNPSLILASGWNIGIKSAKGDIVCRIDAHSEISQDYISKGIETLINLKHKNVVCVGGVLEHYGTNFISKIFANLYSSKFAVGNSPFRTDKNFKPRFNTPQITDTAVFGLYWRWIFEEVGYFDESIKRNQDIALHYKILKRGYKFVTNPSMKIKYYARGSMRGFIKKAFRDGYWIILSEKAYLRHKIPLYFILYILFIPIFLYTNNFFKLNLFVIYLLPFFIYLFFSVYFSIKDGKSWGKFFLLFFFPLLHFSYGIGSLKGIIDKYVFKKNK